MAEEEGFEPPIPFQVRQFSRLEPSTTRPLFLFEVYLRQASSAKDEDKVRLSGCLPLYVELEEEDIAILDDVFLAL